MKTILDYEIDRLRDIRMANNVAIDTCAKRDRNDKAEQLIHANLAIAITLRDCINAKAKNNKCSMIAEWINSQLKLMAEGRCVYENCTDA